MCGATPQGTMEPRSLTGLPDPQETWCRMLDENLADVWTRIRNAAFDAAYLEMPNPDPAGTTFVAIVARHEKRLWAEYWAQRRGHESSVRLDDEDVSTSA